MCSSKASDLFHNSANLTSQKTEKSRVLVTELTTEQTTPHSSQCLVINLF